jgi:hypothetical protein
MQSASASIFGAEFGRNLKNIICIETCRQIRSRAKSQRSLRRALLRDNQSFGAGWGCADHWLINLMIIGVLLCEWLIIDEDKKITKFAVNRILMQPYWGNTIKAKNGRY